jgi:hypothetical protein
MAYSFWIQLKTKVIKAKDIKALVPIFQAFFDVLFSMPKILKYRNRLTRSEFSDYLKLEDTKIYWQPEK